LIAVKFVCSGLSQRAIFADRAPWCAVATAIMGIGGIMAIATTTGVTANPR
jgi:hypothetical protein